MDTSQPSPKSLLVTPKQSSKSSSVILKSVPAQNTRFSPPQDGSRQPTCALETAPLCACGCGNPVGKTRGRWNSFLRNHQSTGRTSSEAQRASARERMLNSNPMKRAEVRQKVSATTKGRPINRSADGMQNIAQAARKRMLSASNPMKQPGAHQAAMAKIMSRSGPSKNELHFMEWSKARALPVEFVGNGQLWIGRRNPDFRIPWQKKLIEVTQRECFTNERRPRTLEDYGAQTARHYLSKGWHVLVIWKKDHRCLIPEQLAEVIRRFASPESNWSGAWNYDRLMSFDEGSGEFVSTT